MENLFEKDASFELTSRMSGADVLNANRTLMSYPSEKSSFQVYLGADGQFEDLYFEGEDKPTTDKPKTDKPTTDKPKYDPEKIAQAVTSTASTVSSVGATIQAFKGDGTKPKSRRKQLKEVCGNKPVLKKNREQYNKCVEKYNAGKIGGMEAKTSAPASTPTETIDEKPSMFTTKNIVIGVVVVGVVATAIYGFKKGWFSKK